MYIVAINPAGRVALSQTAAPDAIEATLDAMRKNADGRDLDVRIVDDAEFAALTAPTADEVAAQEAARIRKELEKLDAKLIRPLAELQTEVDAVKVESAKAVVVDILAQKEQLRARLA